MQCILNLDVTVGVLPPKETVKKRTNSWNEMVVL